jgi:cell shape-determining protein MreC
MSAPLARIVDQYSGRKATQFFRALSEADELCAELDGLRELQCRVQELEAENAELKTQLAAARSERDTANTRRGRTGW